MGHYYVNVANQNLIVQATDLAMPSAGVSMTLQRTYNSQSRHDAAGSDGAVPSIMGNGWTTTFDAHIAVNSTGGMTVFDIDGTQYDYASDGHNGYLPPAGIHALLKTIDGGSYQWYKPNGSVYVFYSPRYTGNYAGWNGRLINITGRNRNDALSVTYGWSCGNASNWSNITEMDVTNPAGQTVRMYFAEFGVHRLVQRMVAPDGVTTTSYSYDAAGDLTSVTKPASNGTRTELYAYGSPWMIVQSPRLAGTGGTEGAYTAFWTDPTTHRLGGIQSAGVMNFAPSDGTNTTLQPGVGTGIVQYNWIAISGDGTQEVTFNDTDGHQAVYDVDTLGRVTAQRAYTGSGWLQTTRAWNADNQLVTETDPRGNQTDYAYDVQGDTVAVARPAVSTSQGTFRPTSLYTYDGFFNVTASCDPVATHALGKDWTTSAPAPGSCPQSTVATQMVYTYPTVEPNGELQSTVTPATAAAPNGYHETYSYDPAREGGIDRGLPTSVVGDSMAQADGTTRQPRQDFWYNASGWLGCYGKGSGTWVLAYDALGRLTSAADPDDGAAGSGICGKAGGQAGWSTATTTSYNADGSVQQTQSPAQRAAGTGVTYTYDLDGNEVTETHHYGCTSVSACTASVTHKWYDGAERLIEVQLPYDAWDIQGYPWSTRYIYDLSAGGSGGATTIYRGISMTGHGNLLKTQELLSGTVFAPLPMYQNATIAQLPLSTASWTDVRATAYDALDRLSASYEAALGDTPKIRNVYDSAGSVGLLAATALATGEVKSYAYDAAARATDVTYANDGGVTPAVHSTFDADGRAVSTTTSSLGAQTFAYDAVGHLTSMVEPASLGGQTLTHDYYADGMRRDVGFFSAAYAAAQLVRYDYRADGARTALQLNNGTSFGWTYTAAGRRLTQSDPLTGVTIKPTAFYTVGKSPVQYPIYPATLTYVPQQSSYDAFGRVQNVTLPNGVFGYSNLTYDVDGGLASEAFTSVQAPVSVNRTACRTVTIRNELAYSAFACPAPGVPRYPGSPNNLNGTWFGSFGRIDGTGNTKLAGPADWTIDARAGLLKSWQATAQDGNAVGAMHGYDASGRLVQDNEQTQRPWQPSDGAMPGNLIYLTGTRSKTYDAENRLRSENFSFNNNGGVITPYGEALLGGYWADGVGQPSNFQVIDYTPDNHPVRLNGSLQQLGGTTAPWSSIWLWDGNDRFLAMSCTPGTTQCAAPIFSLEGLADYEPIAGGLLVHDHDQDGSVVTRHDKTEFAEWSSAPPTYRSSVAPAGVCSAADLSGSTTATRTSPHPNNALAPGQVAAACGAFRAGKFSDNGWTFDYETWQGVRTYDSTLGQWNSPDAYAGDVHDPMSQKPFMWNRNNPYQYSDPSGYDWQELVSGVGDVTRLTTIDPVGGMLVGVLIALSRPAGAQNEERRANGSDKLRNLIANIYRAGKEAIPGGTPGAIRNELKTGDPTEGKYHFTKGAHSIKGLRNWLHDNPDAAPEEVATAQKALDDLKDAFGRHDPNSFIGRGKNIPPARPE